MESNRQSIKLITGLIVLFVLSVISQGFLCVNGNDFVHSAMELPIVETSGMNATFDVVRGTLDLIDGLLSYIF